VIRAEALSRSFDGRPAVEGVTFEVPEGELCALLGPNGAGKTTTIRMLLGLLPATSGRAMVAGVELPGTDDEGARLRRQAGLLTEAPGFYDRISGAANLELFGGLYGLDRATLRDRSEHWLRRLDLWEARERPFGTWSKGMKQRLALIRAVMHEPKVIFLDEPTSGLDPAAAREVRELIRGFRGEGRTILLCTHNLVEAESLATLIGILRRRMLVFGRRGELAPEHPRISVALANAPEPFLAPLRDLPTVRGVRMQGSELLIELPDPPQNTPAIVRRLVELGGEVREVRPAGATLEEIYLAAVGEAAP
jgi:ABC-2 type transport system ATP-binding protein